MVKATDDMCNTYSQNDFLSFCEYDGIGGEVILNR